jgi:hypothetical protein
MLDAFGNRWNSSTSCFCSSLSGKWAAMESARRPPSSIPAIEVKISGGNFLVQFDKLVEIRKQRTAQRFHFGRSVLGGTHSGLLRRRIRRCWSTRSAARDAAFHQHLDGAVRQFEHLQYRRHATGFIEILGRGVVLGRRFCATSRMCLPLSIATSSALMDFGRPTNSGITMCGNTTTSRSGSSG